MELTVVNYHSFFIHYSLFIFKSHSSLKSLNSTPLLVSPSPSPYPVPKTQSIASLLTSNSYSHSLLPKLTPQPAPGTQHPATKTFHCSTFKDSINCVSTVYFLPELPLPPVTFRYLPLTSFLTPHFLPDLFVITSVLQQQIP